jgi:hypothetical protein
MSLITLTTLGILAIIAPSADADSVDAPAAAFTSVAQVKALSESDFGRHTPFRLSGLVISSGTSTFVLETPDGNCLMHTPTNPPPVGAIVVIRGHTKIDRFDKVPILRATNWTAVAKGKVPAPVAASLKDLRSGRFECRRVRTEGRVIDVCNDEVDPQWRFLVLSASGWQLPVAVGPETDVGLSHLLNARIAVTGICTARISGRRRFLGSVLMADSRDAIRVLKPAPSDPFAAPSLGNPRLMTPEEVARLGQRTVRGRVLAVLKDEILLRSEEENVLDVKLIAGERLPKPGSAVCVVGTPETDLYHINFTSARVKTLDDVLQDFDDEPRNVSAESVLADRDGAGHFEPRFHGQVVRLCGIARFVPTEDFPNINLDCDGRIVPVCVHATLKDLPAIPRGSRLSVAGICRMDTDAWQPNRAFPQIRGFTLVPRTADDVRILAYPPFWTPRRLVGTAAGLLAAVVAIFCWRSSVSRAKSRLRIEERTRIAAELHDWLAQNLTAISYRLLAAGHAHASGPSGILRQLGVASTMLNSCRAELRRCIWDLRIDALSESTFDGAVRKALSQVVDLTQVAVRIDISRAAVCDATTHAILCAIRELTVNAFRHGQASHVRIAGTAADGVLTFTVTDDGRGFDPTIRPCSDEGHFGLDNIASRLAKVNGTFSITSQPSKGATGTITLRVQ